MENTFQESKNMLSDKLRKRLDASLDDYVVSKLEEDKDVIFETLNKDFLELNSNDKVILQKISHFATQEKDRFLDKYRACTTFEEFLETKEQDTNRKFLFDLYTMLIGNLTIEEIEEEYCKSDKKVKGLN